MVTPRVNLKKALESIIFFQKNFKIYLNYQNFMDRFDEIRVADSAELILLIIEEVVNMLDFGRDKFG